MKKYGPNDGMVLLAERYFPAASPSSKSVVITFSWTRTSMSQRWPDDSRDPLGEVTAAQHRGSMKSQVLTNDGSMIAYER